VKLAPFPGRAHEAIEVAFRNPAVPGAAELDAVDVEDVRREQQCSARRRCAFEQYVLDVEVVMSGSAGREQADESRRGAERGPSFAGVAGGEDRREIGTVAHLARRNVTAPEQGTGTIHRVPDDLGRRNAVRR